MQKNEDFLLRDAIAEDINFIYSTWLHSLKADSYLGRSTRDSVFYPAYRSVIDQILAADGTSVTVACLPGQSNVILGYLVSSPGVAHFCFVKEAFRGLGLGKALVAHALPYKSISYTHVTNHVRQALNRRESWIFNPFLLFKSE